MTDPNLFRQYVTSGAFKLTLSRQQASALSMVAKDGQDTNMAGHTFGALYRKGLLDHIRGATGNLEYRLTLAGAHALAMLGLAGLTNEEPDPVEAEMAAIKAQLHEARETGQQVARDAWDMRARVQEAELAIAQCRAWIKGSPVPKRPMVTLRDQHPERETAVMLEHLNEAELILKGETT